jgi:hypothetical protein
MGDVIRSNIQYLSPKHEAVVLNAMLKSKANGLYRKGSFASQIIWGNRIFYFHNPSKRFPMNTLHIFRLVKLDCHKFLKFKKSITFEKKLPVNLVRYENYEDAQKITATDINNAYWTIAYQLGYISENTYTKGLKTKLKEVRLSALSSLGIDKTYLKIVKGVITKEEKILYGDKDMKNLYENIRNTCFKHMTNASKLLGKDFIAYKTDCIYYKDTIQNRKKIQLYFKENDFNYKQLVEVLS